MYGQRINTFQKCFADYEEQYVLIGGAACDILFPVYQQFF